MANLSPEEVNKLVRETSKRMNNGSAAVTMADLKSVLTVFEEFTENFDDWTDTLVADFIKETRKTLGLDKKVTLIDELEKDIKKEKKNEKEENAALMASFYDKVVGSISKVFKDYGQKFYENAIQPIAKTIVDNFTKVKEFFVNGFDNIKTFVKDAFFKFGSVFRKVLIGDIKGVLSDAFSIFKSTLMSVLAFPIKLLTGIFSTVVSIASTLYSIAKFAFTFIYKSLSFIASTALRISGFLLRVVLKVAYKILSTVASVVFNVVGFITKSVLGPLLFIAGTLALVLLGIYVFGKGLKAFFNGENSIFGNIGKAFNWIGTTIMDYVKSFFKINGTFFDIMNSWWMEIWEGQEITLESGISGGKSGGLKDAFGGVFSSIIDAFSTWWYGKDANTFGLGGASKTLKDWFMGENGKTGFLGSMKNFLFGDGSASKSFFDIFTTWISKNEWFQNISKWLSEAWEIVSDISKSDWFKNVISSSKAIANAATTTTGYGETFDSIGTGGFALGIATGVLDSTKYDGSTMNVNQGIISEKESATFSMWKDALKHLVDAQFVSTVLSNGDPKKFMDAITLENLKKYLPDYISARLKNDNGSFIDDIKSDVEILNKYAYNPKAGGFDYTGLFDYRVQQILQQKDVTTNASRSPFLSLIENDYDMVRDNIQKMSANVKEFATGGIVTGPTRALIGEAKTPEMVIPLNDSGIRFVKEAMDGMSTQSFSNPDGDKKIDSVDKKLDMLIDIVKNQPAPVQQTPITPLSNPDASVAELVSRGAFEYYK
jgi:hypothetical protein